METDEMQLDTIGDRKTALFVIISDTDDTFNFVVSICTVLFRPSIASLLSFPFRGFGTLPNKQFSTDAPQRGRGKIRKWVPASYACYEYFYPLCPYALLRSYARFCQTYAKEKRCNPQKRLQRSLYPVHL